MIIYCPTKIDGGARNNHFLFFLNNYLNWKKWSQRFLRNEVRMLKKINIKFKINCVFYRENSKIAPPKCWFLNWTFSLKKLYRHVYRTIIHISAKYENPKMHRNGGHHCPTYRLDTFIHYLRPSTLTTTLMDMLSPNNLGGAFLLIVWHLHSFPQTINPDNDVDGYAISQQSRWGIFAQWWGRFAQRVFGLKCIKIVYLGFLK